MEIWKLQRREKENRNRKAGEKLSKGKYNNISKEEFLL